MHQENEAEYNRAKEISDIDEYFTSYVDVKSSKGIESAPPEPKKEEQEKAAEKKVEKKDYDFIPAKRGEDKKPKPASAMDKINELESSLINFLTTRKDIEKVVVGGAKRVRSLKFDINVKESKPFFTVQIGVCEAAFSVDNGGKEKGSCFGAERFIKLWYESGTVATDMHKCLELKLAEKKED